MAKYKDDCGAGMATIQKRSEKELPIYGYIHVGV